MNGITLPEFKNTSSVNSISFTRDGRAFYFRFLFFNRSPKRQKQNDLATRDNMVYSFRDTEIRFKGWGSLNKTPGYFALCNIQERGDVDTL